MTTRMTMTQWYTDCVSEDMCQSSAWCLQEDVRIQHKSGSLHRIRDSHGVKHLTEIKRHLE